ncbi:N-acetylglucosamine-6-phosphate deacetylase [Brevibacillus laterosporus]|uniref:N-acetylglucosamine-6-phosphate deacetylase n=1 Tax=Brevibacillus laterosporus TaxID=1465 RepID=UPI000369BD44|nr:N-acetylglucosamine-6-phosphate deacetylase [Brevibacillus laterosporus]ATO51262.1 N-acetylglucosamine-6-phosphate deacetylase [Brevibacillus laterosporus DSM 25]MBG9804198.1 N-acetylglucosamine-6-phosphate deacetylase [Brevibacillus laterosporus]MED2004088.1 N-acetylglucosamine-6-phosphate deacetylase [Brevibacillus laterosporus]MED4763305.1 N-acetylglucosamine-6-phosphate deacetylase [Brevibacillus laterosporus]TPH14774.1 N-acetylglucosamine-6-phosphate deacetylase [Brevibacillus laterosp
MTVGQTQKIINVNIVTEKGILEQTILLMENGKIIYVGPENGQEAEHVYDGKGATLAPGFIDLHVHGGAGFDFMDSTQEAVDGICSFHAQHGTTGLLATTMTAPIERNLEILEFYSNIKENKGAKVVGVHMEGPFINPVLKGAQNGEWIEPPTLANMQRVFSVARPGLVKLMTLAPELVTEEEVFDLLREQKVVASVGHSLQDYDGACQCLRKGVNHATHLGNAMKGLHHRDVGIIGLAMQNPEMTFDFICDGIHLSPNFIRILAKACELNQMMLITDAMRAAGLDDGQYDLGGQNVTVRGDEARLADGTLAGSVLTLDKALSNFMRFTKIPLEKAIYLLTMNQAKKLGISDTKGSIEVGKDADLVLLSNEYQVMATWVEGKIVFEKAED